MPVVNREVVLPVPRERAWELVTEPDEMETWLAEDVEFEAEEGAPLRIDDRDGVVEHVTEEERIVFSWGDSIVEWVLDDALALVDPQRRALLGLELDVLGEPRLHLVRLRDQLPRALARDGEHDLSIHDGHGDLLQPVGCA